MNELSSVRWTRFADVLTRFASEFPKTLEEIQAEHKARTGDRAAEKSAASGTERTA